MALLFWGQIILRSQCLPYLSSLCHQMRNTSPKSVALQISLWANVFSDRSVIYLSAGCLQTELPYRKCRACHAGWWLSPPFAFSNDFLSHIERYEITVSFHFIVKINWKKKLNSGHCLFLYKPLCRYNFLSFECVKLSKSISAVIFHTDMEIKLNEIHFQTLIIPVFFELHFIDNRSDSDQWSESKRQLHLWNSRSNQCLWLIHYKLKECCLSTCLWWHVQYNCEPLHGSSPNLPRQMTFLLLLLVCANSFHSQLKPAFLYCLTVYWCFATAAMTCINSVLERIPGYSEK